MDSLSKQEYIGSYPFCTDREVDHFSRNKIGYGYNGDMVHYDKQFMIERTSHNNKKNYV